MKLLFIHPNMPGQYKHLCRLLAEDPNNTVLFLTKSRAIEIPGVHRVEYQPVRNPSPSTHHYIMGAERSVLEGQEAWRVCRKLREEEGFVPDVICCHPGWGTALYMKDIFPEARILSFFEFYYQNKGTDVGFDPEQPIEVDDLARVRTKNITNLLSLESADWGITPTFWQHSVHPKEFQSKISVIHDGIDTNTCRPDPEAVFRLDNGKEFRLGDEVVTYIARNFEPYRGFPTFMRAAEIILRERPNCHIIAVGADEVSYGRKLPKGDYWRKRMMEQVKLDMSRMHFTGTLPYGQLIKLFQVSAAHIYLTYPFVLSWSMLESLACGVAIVSSNTSPVLEVVQDGVTGLLADFFSPEDVAKKVFSILDSKDGMSEMRKKAREKVVKEYDLQRLLPLHVGLVKDLARGEIPPPTHEKIKDLYR